MFSGIVEGQTVVKSASQSAAGIQLTVEKPSDFNDLNIGDSICVNGICLTIEEFSTQEMTFSLAAETLQITQWNTEILNGAKLNVERSLAFGDRVHGHLVTGHVETRVRVLHQEMVNGSTVFWLELPPLEKKWIWRKGCVCLNGVSLTVNEVKENSFSVCLIPETLRRTNWAAIRVGDFINIETDYLAKALVRSKEVEQ